MNRLVIYHGGNCNDGFAAAWVAWTLFGNEAEYVSATYGDAPPDVMGREVLIVDFSYPRAVLLEMAAKAKSIRVLDHHKTAEADLVGLDFCTFDMNRSGAGIAWDTLYHGEPRPKLVNYVEDRDLWRWALPLSREVNAWIATIGHEFEAWNDLAWTCAQKLDSVADRGHAILRKVDAIVAQHVEHPIVRAIAGHSVPMVNATVEFSEIAGKLAEGAPFGVAWFQRGDGQYQYSLRSRGDFDVSEVAKRFGGGGHRNAAGFTRPYPPDVDFPRVA